VTRSLVWKELREQRAVWLAVIVAAAAGAAALHSLIAPERFRGETLVGLLWFAAWGYGLVCGSLLMAGENEDDTQTFLDSLPVSRRRVWGIKVVSGLLLLVAQSLALLALGYAFVGSGNHSGRVLGDAFGILLAGVIGYSWGLFCGTFAANVLAALTWTLVLQGLSWLVLYPVVILPAEVYLARTAAQSLTTVWLTVAAAMCLVVVTRSRAVYCRNDSLRRAADQARERPQVQRGWEVLFWLAWRQVRGFALVLAILAIVGSVLVAILHLVSWPLLTAFFGILCGVTTFADEQQTGSYRFAGDQRYPLGRIWLVKVLVRFTAGLAATGLLALSVAVVVAIQVVVRASHFSFDRFQGDFQTLENDLRFGVTSGIFGQPYLFATMWLTVGYAVGLLNGLLFRKPLIAAVVSVAVAYPFALTWLPSLVASADLHTWQVLGMPVLLALASLALMRCWVSDRLLSSRPVILTVAAWVASLFWLTGSLWYRAVEIPRAADAVDLEAFKAELLPIEKNVGGRAALAGLRRLAALEQDFFRNEEIERRRQNPQAPVRGTQAPVRGNRPSFFDFFTSASRVADRGWRAADPRLGEFLDLVFEKNNWSREVAEVAKHPDGMVIDPRDLTLSVALPELQASERAEVFLIARGLQKQQDGDPAVFADYLRTGLALARNMRYQTTLSAVRRGDAIETRMAQAIERWLEKLDSRPDLLRQALEIVQRHREAPPFKMEDVRKAELLVAVNAFSDPRNLISEVRGTGIRARGPIDDTDLMRFSLEVPWEKIRLRRLLDAAASETGVKSNTKLENTWTPNELINQRLNFLTRYRYERAKGFPPPEHQATVAAAALQLALRLYQAEHGKPAESLSALVPQYLPSIPMDPYDGKPFRYRLSKGETLNWPYDDRDPHDPNPPAPTRQVPAGQGILWCVGRDGIDHGGHTQASPHAAGIVPNEDLIFVVPMAAAPK
jgi:ABC-type transport system involved in multi-copper enzyme maturation permease subunit